MKTIPELYEQYVDLCRNRNNALIRIDVAKISLADAMMIAEDAAEVPLHFRHAVETAQQDYEYYADEAALVKEKLVQAVLRL